MREVWLRTNRRAICFGVVPPALLALLGGWLVVDADAAPNHLAWWVGVLLLVGGGGLVVALLVQLRQPRISYDNGQVLFHLRLGPPLGVPVDLVEAFFLGQGPTMLAGGKTNQEPTANLVARLSRRDPTWHEREVKPGLGAWSDGYVTIRGTWCEPLHGEVIRRLNRRLREVSEATRQGEDARK
jgi:hypothetical protein